MKKGFTIIELMVVIAIVAILLTIVLQAFIKAKESVNSQYQICSDSESQCHYVESYTKENNGKCVYLSEEEVRICGNFVIKKLTE